MHRGFSPCRNLLLKISIFMLLMVAEANQQLKMNSLINVEISLIYCKGLFMTQCKGLFMTLNGLPPKPNKLS